MKIRIKRVYDKPAPSDGFRILVDRLWPRGLSKDAARISLWMKDVAPSSKLRTWFHVNKAERSVEFKKHYKKEITGIQEMVALKKIMKEKSQTTLVTAVKDFEHSHIPILLKVLRG